MFSSYYPQSYSPFSQPRRRSYYPSMEEQYQLALAQEQERRRRAAQEAELQRRREQAYLDEMARVYGGRPARPVRRPASYSWFGPQYEDEEDEEDQYAAMMREREQQQQRRRAPTQAPRTPIVRPAKPIQIPISDPVELEQSRRASQSPKATVTPTRTPSPPARAPTPPVPARDLDAAAQTIQTHWRTYHTRSKALRAISDIRAKFDTLRESFVFPSSLDFASPSTSSATPKLLYTQSNKPLHAYEHALTMLLTDVDGVQSGGDTIVREARKKLVRDVEAVLEGLDTEKAKVWAGMQAPQVEDMERPSQSSEEDGDSEMIVDEVSSAASTPLPDSDSESEAAEDEDNSFEFLSAASEDNMTIDEQS